MPASIKVPLHLGQMVYDRPEKQASKRARAELALACAEANPQGFRQTSTKNGKPTINGLVPLRMLQARMVGFPEATTSERKMREAENKKLARYRIRVQNYCDYHLHLVKVQENTPAAAKKTIKDFIKAMKSEAKQLDLSAGLYEGLVASFDELYGKFLNKLEEL